MNGGGAGEGSQTDRVIPLKSDGNGSARDADQGIAGDAADAENGAAGGLEAAGTAEKADAFTGTAAAAKADHPVTGGADGKPAGKVKNDGAVRIVAIGTDADGIIPGVRNREITITDNGQAGRGGDADPVLMQEIAALQAKGQIAAVPELEDTCIGCPIRVRRPAGTRTQV